MKLRLAFICLFCIFICTACNPTEVESQIFSEWEVEIAKLKDQAVTELPDSLDVEINDQFSIHAKILIPESKKNNDVAELTVTRHVYTEQETERNFQKLLEISPDTQKYTEQHIEEDMWTDMEDGINRKSYRVEFGMYSIVDADASGLFLQQIRVLVLRMQLSRSSIMRGFSFTMHRSRSWTLGHGRMHGKKLCICLMTWM
ncbi:MAG: hypothetical protein IJ801_02160 [Lachnospiraceae bacterium]|nr:hypothetical protein [Lachnospiraceae bacterium]